MTNTYIFAKSPPIHDNLSMKLLVGLGNPGKEYEKTRHNLGAKFIEFISRKEGVSMSTKFQSKVGDFPLTDEKIIILQPQTFMNNSGSAVQEVKKFYKLQNKDIYIVFDDLDIAQGSYKIQFGHYPKVHNGVNDILLKLKSDQINFIRIGADGRSQIERKFIQGSSYVLQNVDFDFNSTYEKIYFDFKERVIKEASLD
jgi:PTH1 family peptidyl-tRNA hydrolase